MRAMGAASFWARYSLQGRAERREFLSTHLYVVSAAVLVWIFMAGLLPGSLGYEAHTIWLAVFGRPLRYFFFFKNADAEQLVLLVVIGLIWVCYAVTLATVAVRRLHDRGRTGLWILVMFAAYFLKNPPDQFLLELPVQPRAVPYLIEGVRIFYLLVSVWYIIELGAFPGEPRDNKYGPGAKPA